MYAPCAGGGSGGKGFVGWAPRMLVATDQEVRWSGDSIEDGERSLAAWHLAREYGTKCGSWDWSGIRRPLGLR